MQDDAYAVILKQILSMLATILVEKSTKIFTEALTEETEQYTGDQGKHFKN